MSRSRAAAPEGSSSSKRGGCLTGVVVVLVVAGTLLGLGLYVVHRLGKLPLFGSPQCTAVSAGHSYSYDLQQMQNASTIAAVGVKLDVPTFGIQVAEATALQESKLYNVSGGDRDSIGLFQQRPSQGWGTVDQIMDTTYSSTAFYTALLKVPGWQSMQLADAAQAVQHSADGSAYAGHQSEAVVLAAVFTGTAGGGLTCSLDGPTFSPQATDSKGLTTQGEAVVADAQKQWGEASVEDASAGARTFAMALPSGLDAATRLQRGWAYANWAVAKAEALGITQVGFDGKIWSSADSSTSWQTASSAADAPADRVVLTMTAGH